MSIRKNNVLTKKYTFYQNKKSNRLIALLFCFFHSNDTTLSTTLYFLFNKQYNAKPSNAVPHTME